MDSVRIAQIYTGVIGLLALVGLFVDGHLFGLMNVDMMLDLLRVVLVVALVYAAFVSRAASTVAGVLLFVGILYLAMGVAGLFDKTMMAMLPAGLTGFDVVFHLLLGVVATWAGLRVRVSRTDRV